jgi:hypothetical protein
MNDLTPIEDHYSWWRRAIAEPHLIGKPKLPVHDSHPQCGYYRYRPQKDAKRIPAAIWIDPETGAVMAMTGINGEDRERDANSIWTWVAKTPVSYEAYSAAFETGRWPDEAESADEPAQIGDNSRDMTKQEAAEAAVNRALADAAMWLKRMGKDTPATKDEADQASNLAAAVHKAATAAAKIHQEMKAPILKEERAIDAWKKTVCEPAEVTKKQLLAKATAWQVAEQRRLDEERRKAEAEARAKAEEERRRQIEEINRRAAEEAAIIASATKPEAIADRLAEIEASAAAQAASVEVKATPVPVVKVATGGATGRKAALRTIKTAVITDFAAALAACADTDEIRAAVQAVATKRMRAGVTMVGVEIKEEQEARL